MNLTTHASFLPHDDPEASPAFSRDVLGFEVRQDVGSGTMRWITTGLTDDEKRTYGVRDCALRDPAGNLIRIQQLPPA